MNTSSDFGRYQLGMRLCGLTGLIIIFEFLFYCRREGKKPYLYLLRNTKWDVSGLCPFWNSTIMMVLYTGGESCLQPGPYRGLPNIPLTTQYFGTAR